uniref:LysR substrate-binding domain-containing protein n=1 Tax=Orrella sp. TaxID=1921583 RepID=UPI00405599D0
MSEATTSEIGIDNFKIGETQAVKDEYARRDQGRLVIACTHTQARYALPAVIPAFREQFPKVKLALAEGSPTQLADMLLNGQADLAIATESLAQTPGLASVPCYRWQHAVVFTPDHPLAKRYDANGTLTLADLAEFPIVTYDLAFSGRRHIDESFASAGLQPEIALAAIDADVIKTYVSLGLGIGIIAAMAHDPKQDQ